MFGKTGFVASLLVLGAMVMASVNTPNPTDPIAEPVAASAPSSGAAAISNVNRFAPPGARSAGFAPVPSSPPAPGSLRPSFNGRATSMPRGQFSRSAAGFVGHPYGIRTVPGGGIPGFARPQRVDPDADSDSDSDSDTNNDEDNDNNNNADDNDNSAIDVVAPGGIVMSIVVARAIA